MQISRKLKHHVFFLLLCLYSINGANLTGKTVDSEAVLPSYSPMYKALNITLNAWEFAWKQVGELKDDTRQGDRSQIKNDTFPRILRKILPAHSAIKSLDWQIRFRRKPAGYLDALLNITKLDQIHEMSKEPDAVPFGPIKLRWLEISSACTQMNRFYNKRIRDLINGGPGMRGIVNSFLTYETYTWASKKGTAGSFDKGLFEGTPAQVMKLLYMEDKADIFQGLRNMTDNFPRVLMKNHFEAGACEGNDKHLFIEPNGTDLPFYLLFYLCLVDVKEFMIRNFIGLHNNLFFDSPFPNATDLVTELKTRVQLKIELFDAALGATLIAAGPMYPIRGGITRCDPPPISKDDPRRNFSLGLNYEKLTNFIKVFVAPEQELHRSGTCRVTCDILDASYHRCGSNDTDCQWERERECLLHKGRCDKFNPPCPTGQYRCQNSTEKLSVCPSTRPDRLYESITGIDPDGGFQFGPNDTCASKTKDIIGGWVLEEDVLVNTPHFCEVCTCYCFEPMTPFFGNETTRYFSMRLMEADIDQNRILVGLKFVRIQDQIHIAIADAVSMSGKMADNSTVVWREPKYETDPKYVIRLSKDMRTMNLDDIVTPAVDRVVTGIRFYQEAYYGKVQYNYIGIEIQTHQLDPEGKIVPDSGLFRRNGNNTVSRTPYNYLGPPNTPDDPVKTTGPTLPDSTSNEYIVFVGTSLDKDAAQSTIPYIDVQEVFPPDTASWLRGIGLLHKGRTGLGGFLGFKIIEHRFR